MEIEGFFFKDFKFISDDGHTKTFTHKKTKVLFVKQWLDLVPLESIEFLDGGSEKMYYDLKPNILVKTILNGKYIELPLVEYTVEGANQLYNLMDLGKCATILTGMSILIKDDE